MLKSMQKKIRLQRGYLINGKYYSFNLRVFGIVEETSIHAYQEKYFGILHRLLIQNRGSEEAEACMVNFKNVLGSLREMADIMRNKSIKVMPPNTWPELTDLV